jgi:hypothetical protein
MARNALMPQMQLYDAPAGLDVSNLTNPLMQGMQSYRQGMQQQFEGDRALASEARANRGEARADQALQFQKEKMQVERLGRQAQVVDSLTDPAQRIAAWQRLRQSVPGFDSSFAKYADPNDHMNGPKYLMAESGNYKSPQERENEKLKNDQIRAQTDTARAHAEFYRSRAGALTSQAAPQAPAADPLEGAGIGDDGVLIPKRQAAPSNAYGYGDGEASFGLPGYQQQGIAPPTMRLGGPRDDIDASMRTDEGRAAPRGVQVAQAGGQPPTQMDQARARMYGPSGIKSPEIPGVVTDAGRTRRVDPLATREMQGQIAMDAATPEQQERLLKIREWQRIGQAAFGKPARAGFFYGPDLLEKPSTDRIFKGDAQINAVVDYHLGLMDAAKKKLTDKTWIERAIAGTRPEPGIVGALQAIPRAAVNAGDTAQAFSDLKQAALNIAYTMSGKQVAVSEMKNFIDAYAPTPNDTERDIELKVSRMKTFYAHLKGASRGGRDVDETDIRKAIATAMAPERAPDGADTRKTDPQNPGRDRLKNKYGLE